MPGPKLTVKMHPDETVLSARLKRVSRAMGDLFPFHKRASIMLDAWVQRNFKTEGGNLTGGKWPAFAYGGRAVKKAKSNAVSIARSSQSLSGSYRGLIYIDGTAKLLQDTGDLRKSFAPFATAKDAGVGSWLPYSKPHNEGLGPLPKRRMLPSESEVGTALVKLLEQHAAQAVKTR